MGSTHHLAHLPHMCLYCLFAFLRIKADNALLLLWLLQAPEQASNAAGRLDSCLDSWGLEPLLLPSLAIVLPCPQTRRHSCSVHHAYLLI
jgi:hypothetical protein